MHYHKVFRVVDERGSICFLSGFKRYQISHPLSPLLFIVVMEGLNKMIVRAKEVGLFGVR